MAELVQAGMSMGLTTSSASTLSSASSSGTRSGGWRRTSARMRRAASAAESGAAHPSIAWARSSVRVASSWSHMVSWNRTTLHGGVEVEIVGDDGGPPVGLGRGGVVDRRRSDTDGRKTSILGIGARLYPFGEDDVRVAQVPARERRPDRTRRASARTAPGARARRSAPARRGPRGSGASCRSPAGPRRPGGGRA